ncbi:MAG: ATP-binding protein [Deltaproteobacteria bacterium]|nr:ATP-binding protein [Deltaproteobacteria bacterium]
MVDRLLARPAHQSFFLFGARGTGKSTWLRTVLPEGPTVAWFDLLDLETEDLLRARPQAFAQRLATLPSKVRWVVVDEVQKLPRLLDTVHAVIELKHLRFALSGSSARKLKAGGANMLGGRALSLRLFPFTERELSAGFDLADALHFGTLPQLLTLRGAAARNAFLRAYALTYLKEEVWAEQLVRKLDPFRRFLEVAAQSHGKIVNVANIARDTGVDDKTVATYLEILEDTHLALLLEPFEHSFRRRLSKKPKLYYFDNGVARALARTLETRLAPRTSAWGEAFEAFLITEAHRLASYRRPDYRLSYLRTKDDAEVDLVVERPGKRTLFVAIKSSGSPDPIEVNRLARLAKDHGRARPMLWCSTPVPLRVGEVDVLPWQEALRHCF